MKNIYAIQNDPALAFLLRTPKISLEPLSLHQITKQYSDIFRIDDVDMLDDFVYKKIWSSLSKQDKDVVLAIKKDETKVSEICKKTGMTSSIFSRYRDRLNTYAFKNLLTILL